MERFWIVRDWDVSNYVVDFLSDRTSLLRPSLVRPKGKFRASSNFSSTHGLRSAVTRASIRDWNGWAGKNIDSTASVVPFPHENFTYIHRVLTVSRRRNGTFLEYQQREIDRSKDFPNLIRRLLAPDQRGRYNSGGLAPNRIFVELRCSIRTLAFSRDGRFIHWERGSPSQ